MQKLFWRVIQSMAIFLLAALPPGGIFFHRPAAGWLGMLAVLALHTAELPTALHIAREKNIPTGLAVLKTLLLGFTWWLPLKRGIFQR